jgi:predicted O-methyltransferase YrrM
MSIDGTNAYIGLRDLPPLVAAAADAALEAGFALSCLPSHGRLLQLLAGGFDSGIIAETGTGCGVGLAWLASGARNGIRLISIERDYRLVELARSVFADVPTVTILHGDWQELRGEGPFELLALDGGGQGKKDEPPIQPQEWLCPGGMVVLDDFTPGAGWPPTYDGRPDRARLHWLQHPRLLATDVRTQPNASTIIATFVG